MLSLISGFESTLSLKILASVDYIRLNHPGISVEGTIKIVQNWTERKRRQFKDEYIRTTYGHLEESGSKLLHNS